MYCENEGKTLPILMVCAKFALNLNCGTSLDFKVLVLISIGDWRWLLSESFAFRGDFVVVFEIAAYKMIGRKLAVKVIYMIQFQNCYETIITSDAGSQYRCGRVGRGIKAPSTPQVLHSHAQNASKTLVFGQRPQRGRSPAEHRGTFVCLSVH